MVSCPVFGKPVSQAQRGPSLSILLKYHLSATLAGLYLIWTSNIRSEGDVMCGANSIRINVDANLQGDKPSELERAGAVVEVGRVDSPVVLMLTR